MATCFCVCISLIRSNNQWSELRYPVFTTGSFLSTLALTGFVQVAAGTHTHSLLAWQGAVVRVAAFMLTAEIDEIKYNLLSQTSPGSFMPSIDSSVTKQLHQTDLPVQLLSRWEDGFLMLPTPPSTQNPLVCPFLQTFFLRRPPDVPDSEAICLDCWGAQGEGAGIRDAGSCERSLLEGAGAAHFWDAP